MESWIEGMISQVDLFDNERKLPKSIISPLIGKYFEELAQKMFGGTFEPPQSPLPDLVLWEDNIGIEVKATNKHCHLIERKQNRRYNKLRRATFPLYRPKIYYALFFYKAKGFVWKTARTIVEEINQSIEGCLLLPCSVVSRFQFHKWSTLWNTGSEDSIRYARKTIRSDWIDKKGSIYDVLDFIPKRYRIKKAHIYIKNIYPFPIWICNKKPDLSILKCTYNFNSIKTYRYY